MRDHYFDNFQVNIQVTNKPNPLKARKGYAVKDANMGLVQDGAPYILA